jgi:hypothetical protein
MEHHYGASERLTGAAVRGGGRVGGGACLSTGLGGPRKAPRSLPGEAGRWYHPLGYRWETVLPGSCTPPRRHAVVTREPELWGRLPLPPYPARWPGQVGGLERAGAKEGEGKGVKEGEG